MGRMAELAERHYREHLPTAYAKIKDKPAFFRELEEQAADQIDALADDLTEEPTPGEDYATTRARLNTGRVLAESQVMREIILPTPEADQGTMPEDDEDEFDAAVREFTEARDSL